MKRIVFYIFYVISHHNATFKFAKRLQKEGYIITYAGPDFLEKQIIEQGFEFWLVLPLVSAFPISDHLEPSRKASASFKKIYLKGDIFHKLIHEVKPDLILLDTTFINYSLDLIKYNIPVIIVQTMVALEKYKFRPPLNSSIIPNKCVLSYLEIEFSWMLYFLNRVYSEWSYKRAYGINESTLLIAKARLLNIQRRQLNFRRYLHFGIKTFPEFIFPPKDFDFAYKEKPNQYYVGYDIDTNRTDLSSHVLYFSQKDKIELKPVVYCAFGTLSFAKYELCLNFFEILIDIFKEEKDYNLVLSIGQYLKIDLPDEIPSNVFIFNSVPQLEVLKKTNLMITHGGINSIMECIFSEVPMLVYPLYSGLDQQGNAARVVYHGMGEMGNLSEKFDKISLKIKKILTNSFYKFNVLKMKNKIINNNDFDKCLKYINFILKD
jgi:MGT family glycosyltransferase